MTDELELKKQWMKEANEQTLKTLPAFLEKLAAHPHDYGTICRAIAAAAVGAAWALERSPQGGITGFQAGCVMWDFITGWDTSMDGKPLRLMDFENMLYPQYAEEFDKRISRETFDYLQKQAAEKLAMETHASERIIEHWQSIVQGHVPFGYQVTP